MRRCREGFLYQYEGELSFMKVFFKLVHVRCKTKQKPQTVQIKRLLFSTLHRKLFWRVWDIIQAPGFFTLSAVDLLGQIILDCGRAVVLHHPAFPLDTGTFPVVTTKIDSRHFQMPSGGQSCWLKISVPYFFVHVYSGDFFFHSEMKSWHSLLCLLLFVQNFKYAFPLIQQFLVWKIVLWKYICIYLLSCEDVYYRNAVIVKNKNQNVYQ